MARAGASPFAAGSLSKHLPAMDTELGHLAAGSGFELRRLVASTRDRYTRACAQLPSARGGTYTMADDLVGPRTQLVAAVQRLADDMQAEGLPPLQPGAGVLGPSRKASAAQRKKGAPPPPPPSLAQRAAAIMALGAGRPWWAEQLGVVRAGIEAHHRGQAGQAAAGQAAAAGGGGGSTVQATGQAGQAAGAGHAGQTAVADEGMAEAFADATLWSWWPNLGHKESNPRVSFHGKKRRLTL